MTTTFPQTRASSSTSSCGNNVPPIRRGNLAGIGFEAVRSCVILLGVVSGMGVGQCKMLCRSMGAVLACSILLGSIPGKNMGNPVVDEMVAGHRGLLLFM